MGGCWCNHWDLRSWKSSNFYLLYLLLSFWLTSTKTLRIGFRGETKCVSALWYFFSPLELKQHSYSRFSNFVLADVCSLWSNLWQTLLFILFFLSLYVVLVHEVILILIDINIYAPMQTIWNDNNKINLTIKLWTHFSFFLSHNS